MEQIFLYKKHFIFLTLFHPVIKKILRQHWIQNKRKNAKILTILVITRYSLYLYKFSSKSVFLSINHLNNLNSSNRRSIVFLVCQFRVQTRMQRFRTTTFLEPFVVPFLFVKHLCACRILNNRFVGMEPFYRNFVIGQRWKLKVPKTRVGFRVDSKLHPDVGP